MCSNLLVMAPVFKNPDKSSNQAEVPFASVHYFANSSRDTLFRVSKHCIIYHMGASETSRAIRQGEGQPTQRRGFLRNAQPLNLSRRFCNKMVSSFSQLALICGRKSLHNVDTITP
jgi:hypothetical protein